MPRLQVHSKGARSLCNDHSQMWINDKFSNVFSYNNDSSLTPYLVTPLVNIACCVVVNAKHGNEPVGLSVCLKGKRTQHR